MAASKSSRARRTRPASRPSESLLSRLLSLAVGALLAARLLLPTEMAEGGATLWIVQFWLAAALLWAWNAIREGENVIRWSRLDTAFWMIVAGHAISAAAVLIGGGQKRAAINLTWEWVGLGVCLFLLRQTVVHRATARRLLTMLVAVGVVLAGLGLWQHYVFYGETAREYDRHKAVLEQLTDAPPATSRGGAFRRAQQIRDARQWMRDAGVPRDPTALALWEGRLRSSEPFGLFALANTFAGTLIVWLVVGLGLLLAAWQRRVSTASLIVPALGLGLLGYCLILTKSRTAWVGLACGLSVWGLARLLGSRVRLKRWLIYGAAAGGLLIALLAVAALSGGFDREVLTEAPKSLSYRLQYWTGTWNVLREQPVLGTGPGNFRQHYLHFKLPESSEEIADPHNFVLGIWVNGGLLALLGLLAFLFLLVRKGHSARGGEKGRGEEGRREERKKGGRSGGWLSALLSSLLSPPPVSPPPVSGAKTNATSADPCVEKKGESTPLWSPLTVGGGLGFLLAFAATFMAGEGYDLRLPVLLAGWLAVMAGSTRLAQPPGPGRICLLAAAAALMVHLLGAGGIEMPAIVQILLVLAVAATVTDEHRPPDPKPIAGVPRQPLIAGGLFALLFVVCLLSATVPVLNRRALVATGDFDLTRGHTAAAVRQYSAAAAADPLSPVPVTRLADVYFRRWAALPGDSRRDFERAVGLLNIAIELDPHSSTGYQRLGEWYRARHERTADRADIVSAARAFQQAVARYPHNARLRAELALALKEAGDRESARAAAQAALAQETINRRHRHRDKYLSPERLEQLKSIAPLP